MSEFEQSSIKSKEDEAYHTDGDSESNFQISEKDWKKTISIMIFASKTLVAAIFTTLASVATSKLLPKP